MSVNTSMTSQNQNVKKKLISLVMDQSQLLIRSIRDNLFAGLSDEEILIYKLVLETISEVPTDTLNKFSINALRGIFKKDQFEAILKVEKGINLFDSEEFYTDLKSDFNTNSLGQRVALQNLLINKFPFYSEGKDFLVKTIGAKIKKNDLEVGFNQTKIFTLLGVFVKKELLQQEVIPIRSDSGKITRRTIVYFKDLSVNGKELNIFEVIYFISLFELNFVNIKKQYFWGINNLFIKAEATLSIKDLREIATKMFDYLGLKVEKIKPLFVNNHKSYSFNHNQTKVKEEGLFELLLKISKQTK